MDINSQIEEILSKRNADKRLVSKLGFFSKPVLVTNDKGDKYVIKLYRPLKDEEKVREIMENHDAYVETMTSIGIDIPETVIMSKKLKRSFLIIIIQKAFEFDELARGKMEILKESEFRKILQVILDNTLIFWSNKPQNIQIGFHPTLRNYAIRDNQPIYFDTFPPMLMDQFKLNNLIKLMAPAKLGWVRHLIPNKAVNRVSDEYYQKDKMILGLIGSSCRLRPELAESTLDFSRNYVNHHPQLSDDEKKQLLGMLEKPPQLSGLWVSMRRVFGKTGKPNIK